MRRFVIALMACAFLASACGPAPPEVIIPAGLTSKRTADEVARMMLFEITNNERTLGRRLAAPRIIRIQLMRPGEMYPQRHLDGSNPDGVAMGPTTQPGWMVEAIGTFVGRGDPPTTWGFHGFHIWEDDGSEGLGFFPCGGDPRRVGTMKEGDCP